MLTVYLIIYKVAEEKGVLHLQIQKAEMPLVLADQYIIVVFTK